LKNKF